MTRARIVKRAEQIRSHPKFLDAATHSIESYLEWRIRLGVLNKLIANLARERILEHLLFLHFNRERGSGHGATFERLAASSESKDGVGSRAVRTALRLAQIAGHVTLARSFADGRLRIFEPTGALLEHAGEYYEIFGGLLDIVYPDQRVGARILSEPGYLENMIARIGRSYLAGQRSVGAKADAFDTLLRLDGGRPVLASAVVCYLRGRELPSSPELARRFHISPSQVRAILKGAEGSGLLRLGPRGRLAETEPLTEAYLGALTRTAAFIAEHAP